MKSLTRFHFFAAVVLTALSISSASAYDPPKGIPDPDWGLTHPIDDVRPSQPGSWPSAEAAGHYYIDNTHVSATDTANTYGYPDKPRLTIPEITYAAGNTVWIHGGPYVKQSGDEEHDWDFTGTDGSPVWVLGVDPDNKPEIRQANEVNGEYAIFDNLLFTRDNTVGVEKGPTWTPGGDVDGDCHHVCLRNSNIQGDGTFHSGFGSALSIQGSIGDEVNNIVFYNNTIWDLDDVDYAINIAEDDNHAFVPGLYCNNIYILNNVAYNCSGDAIQVSGNNATGEARAQYIYIGRNTFHTCGENAVDIKSSLDVIISENVFYNFVTSKGSDGTAVVIQQEGGDGCDNVWLLFNQIYNSNLCIRSEETVENIYAIGCLLYNINGTYAGNYTRTSAGELRLIDCTIYDSDSSLLVWDGQASTAPLVNLHGNIFSGKNNASDSWIKGDSTTQSGSSDYNLFDSSYQFRATWSLTEYTTLADWKTNTSQDAGSVYGAPLFVNAAGDNFTLQSGSDAIGSNVENAAYDAFFSRYSLSIKFDIAGNPRPQGGSWDIGAFEYVAGGGVGTITTGKITIGP